jgi:two-component system, chemotaxis family, sensor kinase CheA
VRTEVLDRFLNAVGEIVLTSRQVRTVAEHDRSGSTAEVSVGFDRMERAVGELQRRALSLRTAPLLRVLDTLPRLAREVARQIGKSVEVELAGAELELDRSILDRLADPLVHLVRNAVDHGIESPAARSAAGKPEEGQITIDARRDKNTIRISVADDGAGIDLDAVRAKAIEQGALHPDLAGDLPPEEIAALVFRPGLSTREKVSDISGRGVGMDAVKATVEALGGHVELRSQPGRGTVTTLVVPITAAVQRVLLVGLGEEIVAVPIAKVERIVELSAASIERSGHEAFALVDGEPLLVLNLTERLGLNASFPAATTPVLLVDLRGQRVGVQIERLAGQQEIYVKPVPALLASARALAGMTVLGDGRPIFVLDLNQIA